MISTFVVNGLDLKPVWKCILSSLVQGGEFKSKASENLQFWANDLLYCNTFYSNVLEHSFVHLF